MHRWIVNILIVLTLGGCDELADQQSEGVTLATLHGTISLGANVKPPSADLSVSVLWHDPLYGSHWMPWVRDDREPKEPVECDNGQLTGWLSETRLLEQPVRIDTDFPSGFTVELTEPPPEEALYVYPEGNGLAGASGDLVVYEDRNGNGRLDPSTGDVMSPDLVFGSSQGTAPWGIGQGRQYVIMYANQDAGYTLVTLELDQAGVPVPSTQPLSEAMLALTLDPSLYAQQMACTVMCRLDANDTIERPGDFLGGDVGMRVVVDLGVGTTVWSKQDGAESTMTLARCSRQDHGDGFVTSSLELSVVVTEGCTTSTISYVETVATDPDHVADLPCPEYRELEDGDFPSEL